MSITNPFFGEIRIFPFSFNPAGWAHCDGQLLAISFNTALYSILGVTYGGDGKNTFALPNLQGRAAMHRGHGPGLSIHNLGEEGGDNMVTLDRTHLPEHAHPIQGIKFPVALEGNSINPSLAYHAEVKNSNLYSTASTSTHKQLLELVDVPQGAGVAHNNMQPYLTLYFCIALQGVFPRRS